MQLAYFPEEFHQAAPTIIGHFCAQPNGEWLTLVDVVQTIQAGHTVTIRHASESEMARAEAFVALYQVGQELAAKLDVLLDMHPPEKVDAAKAATCDILAVDLPFPPILDGAEG